MSRSADQIAPTIFPELLRLDVPGLEPSHTSTAEPILRIHILGTMRATTYLGDEVLPRGRKARAILGCLCLAAGARIKRRTLAAMMWDRVPPDQARTSFRQAFRELVVAFGPLVNELIIAERETIRLNTDLCWIDALALTVPAASQDPLWGDLAALCHGELLERLDDVSVSFRQWVVAERASFAEKCRQLRKPNDGFRVNPEAGERAEIARRLIAFGPTYEGASRVLMRALADMGEPAQAIQEYTRCERALRILFNAEPSAQTKALYGAIGKISSREDHASTDIAGETRNKTAAAPAQPQPNRSRLRIGVLPFRTDPSTGSDDLAVSLSEEVAADLARFRWFDVIAVFAVGAAATPRRDDQMRPNELDYVVDGTLRTRGNIHHIKVRLLDLTSCASPIWTNEFALAATEPYCVNEVTARIVARIDPVVLFIEGKRRERHGATGLLLRAIPLMYTMKRREYEEAGDLIMRALEEEPDNAKVAAWAAHWQVFHVGQGWAQDPRQALAAAQHFALKAIAIDPKNAEALGIYAHICSFMNKDFDAALYFFDRSLRLNPNLGFVWALSAVTQCYLGEPDAAPARMDRYRELAPHDPYFSFFEGVYAIAYLLKSQYQRAAGVGRRLVKGHPGFSNGYKPLIAALGHLKQFDEAKPYVAKVLELEPQFSVSHFGKTYPFRRDGDRERYLEGLRLAGVPEQ
jgi:DNA-binding SARP family transcriptional activator